MKPASAIRRTRRHQHPRLVPRALRNPACFARMPDALRYPEGRRMRQRFFLIISLHRACHGRCLRSHGAVDLPSSAHCQTLTHPGLFTQEPGQERRTSGASPSGLRPSRIVARGPWLGKCRAPSGCTAAYCHALSGARGSIIPEPCVMPRG